MIENLNMNIKDKVVIRESENDWIGSLSKGVLRKPLERENFETGHTTSLVKYLPGTKFSEHSHPLGEEIFVLEGTFSDEFGDYEAGTYLRNPPGSFHSPFSKEGCLLFVKLNQFQEGDKQKVIVNTKSRPWLQGHGGLKVMPLYSFGSESSALVKWPKDEKFISHSHYGGEEILVLGGEFKDEHGSYPKYCWIRSPHLSSHDPWVNDETVIFVKTGHLLK